MGKISMLFRKGKKPLRLVSSPTEISRSIEDVRGLVQPTRRGGQQKKTSQTSFQINPKKNRTEKSPTKTSKEPKLAFVLFVVGIFCSPALKFHQKHHPKLASFCLSFSTSQGWKICKFDEVSERTQQGAQKKLVRNWRIAFPSKWKFSRPRQLLLSSLWWSLGFFKEERAIVLEGPHSPSQTMWVTIWKPYHSFGNSVK